MYNKVLSFVLSMTDLSKILKSVKTGWVALTPDNERVVAKAKSLREVLKMSAKKGVKDPSVIKAAPFENYFIG